MRLLGLDFEATDLDTSKARITEIGVVLWDTDTKRPLVTFGCFCHDASYPEFPQETLDMMERVCGISLPLLKEFGTNAKDNLVWLEKFVRDHKVDYLVGHNSENYDKPLLYAELTRHGVDAHNLRGLPWVDTRTDLPFATEPDSRKLKHLAGDHGFVNPFSHRAVFDVLTMLRILSNYDITAVLEYQKIPSITMRALVSYDQRDLAKAQRYSWEKIGDKTFPKQWVKRIKANTLEQEKAACKFQIARIE